MGIERESFVGNPNKVDLIVDDEDLEYLSGDEIEFIPFVLQAGDPDLMLQDQAEIVSDDDDESYNPADDFEEFLSDSDFIADSDGSGLEDAEECDSDEDAPPDSDTTNTESTSKVVLDSNSSENKISGETKNNSVSNNSANEDDTDS